MKHNLLFFSASGGIGDGYLFFCYALKHGPLLGRFKMVYCAIIFRIIRSPYINHFGTPTNLNYVRPALARSYWNIVWLLHYLAGEVFMLMPYKPGLRQGQYQKKDTHPLDFDVTLVIYVKDLAFNLKEGVLRTSGKEKISRKGGIITFYNNGVKGGRCNFSLT